MNSPDHYNASQQPEIPKTDFERLYLAIREREKRVYTDMQVSSLPNIDITHPHCAEWQTRKRSADRLVRYLSKKQKPLNILEVGCGNGWLAAKMAAIPKAEVTAMDVNLGEINQASRVFKKDNLRFMYDAFTPDAFNSNLYDVIVFAAVLPYFPSLKNILQSAVNYLKPDGELHILDTPFYTPLEAPAARRRCVDYYTDMGFPEMADYYFHHTLFDLDGFKFRVLTHPGSLLNRIIKKEKFYWITVDK